MINTWPLTIFQPVFSCGKNISSIVVATLVDKGLLKYDAKVAEYWPEFGINGKENIKIVDILRHEGGLTTLKHSFERNEFSKQNIKNNVIGNVIESCEAIYPKNHSNIDGTISKRSYHSTTRGLILNEIVRRVDPKGRTIGEICREDLELDDLYCGIRDKEFEQLTRLEANTLGWVAAQSILPYFLGSSVHISIFDLYRLTRFMQGIREKVGSQRPIIKNLPKDPKDHHTTYEHPETRKGEIPSANFHGNARSLAKLASIMANKGKCEENGKQLFSENTWTKMHDNSTWADDAILGIVCKLVHICFTLIELNYSHNMKLFYFVKYFRH